MGFFGTAYMFAGLSLLTLSAFGICSFARLVFGHRVAKRWHELLLGYGMYYWMRIAGYWRIRTIGAMPTSGAYVIVSNHATDDITQSFMDHCLVSHIPLPKKYLTKREYFTLPFFGWTQWIVGDVGVDVRSRESREQSLDQCRALLRSGDSVVIYPEGTRSPTPPTLRPFKDGAFRLAYECDVPVLPVALINTHLAMGRGMVAGSANLELHVGTPIRVTSAEDIPKKRDAVAKWMCDVLGLPYEAPAATPKKESSGPTEAAKVSWEPPDSASISTSEQKKRTATEAPAESQDESKEEPNDELPAPVREGVSYADAVRTHPDNVPFAEDPLHHAHVVPELSFAEAVKQHPDTSNPPQAHVVDDVGSDMSVGKEAAANQMHHDRVTPSLTFAQAVLENTSGPLDQISSQD